MYQTLKGTYDILPDKFRQYEYLEKKFKEILSLYGYHLMKTPVIEHLGVFQKENDTSDMVTKEMFSFSTNEKDIIALRPEGTAGIIRSFIENKLYGKEELPVKLAYIEEMFRHEKPQKGRQRQFTQLGIENIGHKSPLIDAEVIALGYTFIKDLGINNIKVLVNTLGDSESRLKYAAALKQHFEAYKENLCHDCQNRLVKNPLRILDCKLDHEQDCIKEAPLLSAYLSEDSKLYFEKVLAYLDILKIPYEVSEKLVRGLDYYTDTVFEVVSTNPESGSQATIFAGGRYDELVQQLGGPELSGIGFAIGEERLLMALESENLLPTFENDCDVYLIDLSEGNPYVFEVAQLLRLNGYRTILNVVNRSLKSQFKSSDRFNARYTCIIGEDEVNKEVIQLKDNASKTQIEVKKEELVAALGGKKC